MTNVPGVSFNPCIPPGTSESGSQKPSLVTLPLSSLFLSANGSVFNSAPRVGVEQRKGAERACPSDEGNVSFQLIARRAGVIELEIYDIKIHKLRREIISRSSLAKIYSLLVPLRAAFVRVPSPPRSALADQHGDGFSSATSRNDKLPTSWVKSLHSWRSSVLFESQLFRCEGYFNGSIRETKGYDLIVDAIKWFDNEI